MENVEKTAKNAPKTKVYSANEICNIIKTCSKNGVTNIKISGIEVNFENQGTDSASTEMSWPSQKRIPKNADSTPLKPLELDETALQELRDLETAQQAIDDPIGYEENMIQQFIDGDANEEINGHN